MILRPFQLMVLEPVHCPGCDGTQVIKHSKTPEVKQRYRCQDGECKRSTFIGEYSCAGLLQRSSSKFVTWQPMGEATTGLAVVGN